MAFWKQKKKIGFSGNMSCHPGVGLFNVKDVEDQSTYLEWRKRKNQKMKRNQLTERRKTEALLTHIKLCFWWFNTV